MLNLPPLQVAAATEAKQPGQTKDQDSLFTAVFPDNPAHVQGLFIVADGVGGYKEGNLASQLAVETVAAAVKTAVSKAPSDLTPAQEFWQKILRDGIQSAHKEIAARAKEKEVKMASTISLALVVYQTAVIANVGDSRTYYFSHGELQQITRDHSLVNWLVQEQHITPTEALNHPYRNVLTHALGSPVEPAIDFFIHPLFSGASLILCSDGIWNTLSDEEIVRHLQNASTAETAVASMMKAAQDHSDDLTLILVQIP